jgi:hypothetical protein
MLVGSLFDQRCDCITTRALSEQQSESRCDFICLVAALSVDLLLIELLRRRSIEGQGEGQKLPLASPGLGPRKLCVNFLDLFPCDIKNILREKILALNSRDGSDSGGDREGEAACAY